MTTSPGTPLVFLDANVLAKPVTRSLILFAAHASSYAAIWSQYVEAEADRHLRPAQSPVSVVRAKAGMDLSPTSTEPSRFMRTAASDRQVLADAAHCGAVLLVTEDVDDFAVEDLATAGLSAVNPDLFLSERATPAGYRIALQTMASAFTHPARTPQELHVRLGRQHPLTTHRHAGLFDVPPMPAVNQEPAVMFRGNRCLRCLRQAQHAVPILCPDCQHPRGR
ncbi:MAG: hypothetical protein LBM66_07775, partial [Bifidobacteriaceae bacterium]|nr:hypothetical protein [Bifidobacteriaceae bacterium]